MRIWNGLKVTDIVMYNNKKYRVKNLYIENDKRICDLTTFEDEEIIIKGVSVSECEKIAE